MPLRHFLQMHTCWELPQSFRDIVSLSSQDPVRRGFEVLLNNNVQSAPVYDCKEKTYIGFLDIRELIEDGTFGEDDRNAIFERYHEASHSANMRVLAKRHPWHSVSASDPLSRIAVILGSGVHRVAVLSPEGRIVRIASQSALFKCVANHVEKTPSICASLSAVPIKDVATCKNLISCSETSTALAVFEKSVEHKGVCMPVVDNAGKLLAYVTARDMKRCLEHKQHGQLQVPVLEYLCQSRGVTMEQLRQMTAAVCIAPESSLNEVFRVLSACNTHHLFLVSEETLVGILTLTDLMRYLVTHQL